LDVAGQHGLRPAGGESRKTEEPQQSTDRVGALAGADRIQVAVRSTFHDRGCARNKLLDYAKKDLPLKLEGK